MPDVAWEIRDHPPKRLMGYYDIRQIPPFLAANGKRPVHLSPGPSIIVRTTATTTTVTRFVSVSHQLLLLRATVSIAEQGHCGACRRKWQLADTNLCPCGETQTMSHIVEFCPPDKTEWRLIPATLSKCRRCFLADQLRFMTRIREGEDCANRWLPIPLQTSPT